MRTTIRMNAELAGRARRYAARHNQTFTQAVASCHKRKTVAESSQRVTLPAAGDAAKQITEEELKRAMDELELGDDLRKLGGVLQPIAALQSIRV